MGGKARLSDGAASLVPFFAFTCTGVHRAADGRETVPEGSRGGAEPDLTAHQERPNGGGALVVQSEGDVSQHCQQCCPFIRPVDVAGAEGVEDGRGESDEGRCCGETGTRR